MWVYESVITSHHIQGWLSQQSELQISWLAKFPLSMFQLLLSYHSISMSQTIGKGLKYGFSTGCLHFNKRFLKLEMFLRSKGIRL